MEQISKQEKKILEDSKKYSDSKGFSLNNNEKILFAVIKALGKNEEKHGKRFCPCRVITGNAKEDAKIVCPCIYHIDEIKTMGHCKCQLFFANR